MLPVALTIVIEIGLDRTPITGDLAAIEFGVLNALRLEQLVGVYSRHGWFHPGPLQFYLLAPGYWLSGYASAALFIGTAVANLGALALMAATWWRTYRCAWTRLVFLAFVSVLMVSVGSIDLPYWETTSPLSAPWNPLVVVLPYGAFILLCARLGEGDLRLLPAAVALHAFLAQTHAGCALVATGALLVGLGYLVASWQRRPAPERSPGPWVGLSAVVLGCAWLLPLLDQLSGNGNLLRVLQHATGSAHIGCGQGIVHTALHITDWRLPLFTEAQCSRGRENAALVVAAVQLLLLVVSYRRARSCNWPFTARLCSLLTVLFLLSPLAAWRLDNERYFYLTLWLPMQSALTWAVIVVVSVRTTLLPRPHVSRAFCILAVVVTIVASAAHVRVLLDRVASSSSTTWKSTTVAAMVEPAVRQLRIDPDTTIRETHGGGVLVGLVLQLVKRGLRPRVSQAWCRELGSYVKCTSPSNPELVVRRQPASACQQLVRQNALSLCLERR
ncbi:MAG: hypothetical protein AB8I80_18665 [Anaerolineae bacterium]